MGLYTLTKSMIFSMSPERAHSLAIFALKHGLVFADHHQDDEILSSKLWGMDFSNPVGLAAGFDKNAEVACPMLAQGFGFVETGTVTPKPQEGNPQPRLFRLTEDKAVINRMGFNNLGLEVYAKNLKRREGLGKRGIVGANIGANKDSEDPINDYVICLKRLLGLANYFTINISSPNTPGLRKLQGKDALDDLLSRLIEVRSERTDEYARTPLLVKVAPDLDEGEQKDIAEMVLKHNLDGLIVSNTTIGLRGQLKSEYSEENGGLSGAPLFDLSTEVLSRMYKYTEGKIPLIGVGGIQNGREAYQKIKAGASLVQLYSALVFHGPGLVRKIKLELADALRQDGFSSLGDAIGIDHK